jgi:hypothetical protein
MSVFLRRVIIVSLAISCSTISWAGGLEKGFEALHNKDYYEARKQFQKIIFKAPTGANFGLSELHSLERSPYFDVLKALRYVNSADSAFAFSDEKERDQLNALGIDRERILLQKVLISDRAYEELIDDPRPGAVDTFLLNFKFSSYYDKIILLRDERVFEKVEADGSYEAYRNFIIEYPGSTFRAEADSLYALRLFESKTADGDAKDYMQFVKEFPASPYAEQAYDSIFTWLEVVGTEKAYYEFVQGFPINQYTLEAWSRIMDIRLRDYSEKSMYDLLADYPENPLNDRLKSLMALRYALRIPVETEEGYILVDREGQSLDCGPYEDIAPFSEGMARVEKDGLIGYIDLHGEEVVPCRLEDAYDYSSGLAIVEEGGLFGALDRSGRYVIPTQFDELGRPGSGLIPFRVDSIGGYLDYNGQLQDWSYQFVSCGDFNEGYAVAETVQGWGMIDTSGTAVVPFEYDWVDAYSGIQVRVRRDSWFGLYQVGDSLLTDLDYQGIGLLRNGKRLVAKDGLYGYLDEQGKQVIDFQWTYQPDAIRYGEFRQGYAVAKESTGWGLIDILGEYVHEPGYDAIKNFDGRTMSYRKGKKWGFMDVQGQRFPATYDEVSGFTQGFAVVMNDSLYGMVNLANQMEIPFTYESLEVLEDTEFIKFGSDGKIGLMNRNSEIVLEALYDDIRPHNIRYFICQEGEAVSIYDADERQVVWNSQ